MTNLFFDLDDILAEEQLIKSKFIVNIPWHGCLYTQEPFDQDQISVDYILELPYWLAYQLFINDFLDLSQPKCFGIRMREALQMGPKSVHLHDICPFYFIFTQKIMSIWMDDPLYQLVFRSYMSRFSEIIRISFNNNHYHNHPMITRTTELHPFYLKLDVSERELFKIAS